MGQPRDGTRPYDLDAVLRIGLGIGPTNEVRLDATGLLAAGPVVVDVSRHEAWLDAREVQLTAKELQLLAYLIHRGGRVANQHEISTAMWGHEADTNTVAVHIKRLRDKLGQHPVHGQLTPRSAAPGTGSRPRSMPTRPQRRAEIPSFEMMCPRSDIP